MRLLRDILLIYRRQVRQSLRVPMTLVLGLLQPILYLLLFGPVFSQVSTSFGTEATGLQLFVPGHPRAARDVQQLVRRLRHHRGAAAAASSSGSG